MKPLSDAGPLPCLCSCHDDGPIPKCCQDTNLVRRASSASAGGLTWEQLRTAAAKFSQSAWLVVWEDGKRAAALAGAEKGKS